jgi:zinc protease
MRDRKRAPLFKDAIDFDYVLPDINREIWNNNLPVYWLNAGTQEVVQIDWIFKAGLWHEPATAVAQAVAALVKNGTARKSALEINEAIEYHGAALKVVANNDYTIVTLHTLTRHLPALLPVVKEVLTEAVFPEKELELYQQNGKQRLAVNLRQCDFVANRNIDAMLFGKKHPYGRFTNADDIDQLNTELLRGFYREHYHSGNCRIFMAGCITEQDVHLVKELFGKEAWGEPHPVATPSYTIEPAADHIARIQNDETGVQGAVRIARHFPGRKDPDFTPAMVLNTIFGGYFGSRLMANIREEKGYTYGIYAHIYNYRNAGALLIATEAGKEVCEATVSEVYKEMDLLCNERVNEEELLLVKNYLLGNLLGDLDGPFSILQRWKNIILNDLPDDQFERNIHIYKTVTATELMDLAQKYLRKEDYYELVVV